MRTSYSDRETFSEKTCEMIARIDGVIFGEEQYSKLNLPQYYVAINSWLLLFEDTGNHEAGLAIGSYMKSKGLIETIKLASNTADYMISIANNDALTVSDEVMSLETLLTNDLRIALQVLRYLKRFTPKTEALLLSAAANFLMIQDRLNWRKHVTPSRDNMPLQLPPYDRVILDRMVPIFKEILGNWKLYYDCTTGHFSNGNCADAKCLADKLKQLARYQTCLDWDYYPIFPIEGQVENFVSKILDVIAVPKNYKQGRLIAPEPAYVNWHANRLLDALILVAQASKHWKRIATDDQSRQWDRAYIASLSGGLATIDSTSASDSIARYNMRYILDNAAPGLWEVIAVWLPKKYRVNGKTVTASTFLTSGNPVTFILESIFFYAAAMAARDIHYEHTGVLGEKPTTFGDDLEVDIIYIDETIMVLDRLGVKVNIEKTFSCGNYRESCGVEYLKGEPMRSVYWPRAQVLVGHTPTAEDYAHLVELEHRMYSHPRLRLFLCDVVTHYWPHVTLSQPSLVGSEFDELRDLWGIPLIFHKKARPIGAYWHEDYVQPEYRDEYGYVVGHTQVCAKAIKPNTDTYEGLAAQAAVEMYEYQQWLKTGPTYRSDLDRKFGIVTPRSLDGVYGHPNTVVKILY